MATVKRSSRAFTLVELLVSVAIFVLMTGLLVSKYGTFNQSVLLTNLTYDIALTIRTAQAYGLSVKSVAEEEDESATAFSFAYGVHFNSTDTSTPCASDSAVDRTKFVFFVDNDPDQMCDSSDGLVSTYHLKRGAVIYGICDEIDCDPSDSLIRKNTLDITFKRPDPSAHICVNNECDKAYVKIQVQATDGSARTIEVRSNGQITVND